MANPELRMTMYKGHVDHANIWQYQPVNWHTWKFRVWPNYDFDVPMAVATQRILLIAAKITNKIGDDDVQS